MSKSKWPYFSEEELSCPCCGENKMDDDFMDAIVAMRESLGFAFIVTSGYRCPDYNDKIASTGRDGPHTTGRAMDIHVYGAKALMMMGAAQRFMTGIGLKQHGDYSGRFIHVDDLPAIRGKRNRPWTWTYV